MVLTLTFGSTQEMTSAIPAPITTAVTVAGVGVSRKLTLSPSPFLSTRRWRREGNLLSEPSIAIDRPVRSVGDDSWRSSRAGGRGLQVSWRIGSPHVRQKVRVAAQLVNVEAVFLPVSQTAADKRLRRTKTQLRPQIFPHRRFETKLSLWAQNFQNFQCFFKPTLASLLDTGLAGNCTSVALRMVFSWSMSCWDWLWPNGYKTKNQDRFNRTSF